MMRRFSSRRQQLDQSFLTQRLYGARAYDRIAGYCSSSMLEVAGEALETISGPIRIVCNSELEVDDVETARAANYAMRREWCAAQPERHSSTRAQERFARLYEFLRSGRMQVKVLPCDRFGLVHGQAGVITLADGSRTCFMGSVNETYRAWKLNYELVWEDEAPEAIAWVQEEFEALWHSPFAVPLAGFVIEDVGRLAQRPVYCQEYGLWEHQKYFVKLAFDAHRGPHGARFMLADMGGLGKPLQLATAGMLMALYGTVPVLILAPKTLLWQWQDEMRHLLDLPSAVWTGKQWVDEHGIEYPGAGPEGIKKCPRRVGLVSQGLITSKSEVVEYLKQLTYECVIVDEAHRARRKNLGPQCQGEKPVPNNLLAFLHDMACCTRSLLLATATPVQLYPVEAWDLLHVLAVGNEHVLGNAWSHWRHAAQALDLVMGQRSLPEDDLEVWGWLRQDAYTLAEEFCRLLARRIQGAEFLKTLLLRRVGSTMYAGRKTAANMLGTWEQVIEAEDEEELEAETCKSLTPAERVKLQAFINTLEANQERDPKCSVVLHILRNQRWLDAGCIVFSQDFDSIWWLAQQLTQDMPQECTGIYAGGQRSGVMVQGVFTPERRDELKQMVQRGELRLLLGTDAASEGLNLQRLGTLINLDLPWNPTRLEQRKGRIQRIGQLHDTVRVYNMRYTESVEDRVHQLLSARLASIYSLFGQLPNVLEDVWIKVALGQTEHARTTIDAVPRQHPFEMKYHKITKVPWESCTRVLDVPTASSASPAAGESLDSLRTLRTPLVQAFLTTLRMAAESPPHGHSEYRHESRVATAAGRLQPTAPARPTWACLPPANRTADHWDRPDAWRHPGQKLLYLHNTSSARRSPPLQSAA
jgi:hypothetical protein